MADGYWYHGSGKLMGEFCHIKPNDKERYGEYVKVVRCKDCKSWNRFDDVQIIGSCNRHGGVYIKRETDFCSWGERKDEVENG